MSEETKHPDGGECRACKWWIQGISVLIGECRRNAPMFADNPVDPRVWAHTKRKDWCGEFERQP